MERYCRFSTYLRKRFGCRVHRVSVDAGFSCPNRDGTLSTGGCVFCENRAFSATRRSPGTPLREQVVLGMERARARFAAEKFLVYFQANTNTYGPAGVLKERYDVIREFPDVVGLCVGTRPDCVDEGKLALLESYSNGYEVWVEYGLQSVHERTLRFINRNHTYRDFLTAFARTRKRNVRIGVHVIIGLPGETEKDILETAREMGRLAPDGIKIHPFHIVKGTKTERLLEEGAIRPMEEPWYADICTRFLEYLDRKTVVQRLSADCHPDFLVAPQWLSEKSRVLREIDAAMEQMDRAQGRKK